METIYRRCQSEPGMFWGSVRHLAKSSLSFGLSIPVFVLVRLDELPVHTAILVFWIHLTKNMAAIADVCVLMISH